MSISTPFLPSGVTYSLKITWPIPHKKWGKSKIVKKCTYTSVRRHYIFSNLPNLGLNWLCDLTPHPNSASTNYRRPIVLQITLRMKLMQKFVPAWFQSVHARGPQTFLRQILLGGGLLVARGLGGGRGGGSLLLQHKRGGGAQAAPLLILIHIRIWAATV